MHHIGFFRKNGAFVDKLVATYGDKKQYETLLMRISVAEQNYRTAAAKIVRHKVGS